MPSANDYPLLPPKRWDLLEDLLWDLFRVIWNDPDARKVGTYGASPLIRES